MNFKSIILIAGPTASGKTDLAIRIARAHNCLIINADSMQVYSKVKILTARPEEYEFGNLEHRLFAVVSPSENFSTGRWLSLTKQVLNDCKKRGKNVIIVGGTGLYFRALLEGLSQIVEVDNIYQEELENKADSKGIGSLYDELLVVDAKSAAQIKQTDRQRIIRALGVYRATGVALSSWWEQKPSEPLLERKDCTLLSIFPDRDKLYGRINARCDRMVESGVIDEVKDLLSLVNKDSELERRTSIYKAIGLREFEQYLNKEIDLDKAIEDFKTSSRRYAKRQYTWMRKYMVEFGRICSLDIDQQIAEIKGLGFDVFDK